jgi:hypothetical protein
MIYNLFSYPSNFGVVKIYKCDYFGNQISATRPCFVDQFTVNVQQDIAEEQLRFGDLNQSNTFRLKNRHIKITATFLFELDPSGLLSQGSDLLFNLCQQAYQGSNVSYKLSLSNLTSSSATYNEILIPQYLQIQNTTLPYYKFYLTGETSNIPLNVASINTSTANLSFSSISVPMGTSWIELFQYGNNYQYPIQLEPMFRLDTSEGSFYHCLIDKISFTLSEDFVKLNVEIVCTDYDRSTRYDFINTTQITSVKLLTRVLHKSRIKIQDFYSTAYSFNVAKSTLEIYNYMNGLITQSFSDIPVKELSLTITNNLQPVYGNNYYSVRRTFVRGYISKSKKIEGTMSVMALRSTNPTFDKFPFIGTDSAKNLSINFGPQQFNIPYTVWGPGKLEINQSNYANLSFDFIALTNQRQGQPDFNLDNATNF